MYTIAADVGGTNTRFVAVNSLDPTEILHEAHYISSDFDSFEPLLRRFIAETLPSGYEIGTLSLALPGIVENESASLTNLPWTIEKKSLLDSFSIENIVLMNDFQASATGTKMLSASDTVILNTGMHKSGAVRVAVGAGTGLGVAWMQGENEHASSYSTEAGHTDFAPADNQQVELLQFLMQRYRHVSYERLLSGAGLVNLYEYCSGVESDNVDAQWVNNAAEQGNQHATMALMLFVKIYGAFVSNMALIFKPEDGIYITGGIALKIKRWMKSKEFMESYLNKGRMQNLVSKISVYLVTNENVGVLGALTEAEKIHQVQQS